MTVEPRPLVLLGPQRFAPAVSAALEPLVRPGATAAVVTAGWEEREAEDVELGADLPCEVVNLALHRRTEDVLERDPELFAALRGRRDDLRELQRLYRVQLRYLGRAAEELLRREGGSALLDVERASAIEHLHTLDDHRIERVGAINADFEARWQPAGRSSVAAHRDELRGMLEHVGALCVAGGHVGSLYTSLWLFDIPALLPPTLPIVAWSAGAMVLAERIVLFHDHPPQGRGYAEVWGPGLGLAEGVVPLPDAARRLQLDNPTRVQLLARRFPDKLCATLDEGARLVRTPEGWSASEASRLTETGAVAPVGGEH